MLKKLLKYDLRWLLKIIVIFHGLGLFFACIGRLIDLLPDSLFFTIISGIFKGTAISMVVSSIINTIIRSWVRFTNNLYKDESYLTHTLPIKKEQHLLSKVLSSIIVIGISVVICVISLVIMYLNKDTIEFIKQSLNILSQNLNGSIVLLIILVLIVLFLEVVFIVLCGIFGIVYGHSYNQKKLFKSFVFGFIIYLISTLITLTILMLSTIFIKDLHTIIFSTNPVVTFGLLVGLLIFAVIIYTVYCVIIYILTLNRLKKGVNID
ncbi:MAG: hypothetical protein IJE45_01145 [Bacilli bacterium]|nr:hypothetical protein [Bacilli bacterium]